MSKPYRERAELFAQNPQGRIYGGFYPGQGFGTFGGGIDPGEDPQEAAAREFQEESGYPVTNVRPAPVDPYVEDWKPLSKKPEYANDPKFQERFKKFKGSRTHYFLGDIAGKRGLKDTGDSVYPFESVRFRTAPAVISKHEKDLQSVTDPIDVARLQQRLAVLQSMLEKKAMPFKSKAQPRSFPVEIAEHVLQKTAVSRWREAIYSGELPLEQREKLKAQMGATPERYRQGLLKGDQANVAKRKYTLFNTEEKARDVINAIRNKDLELFKDSTNIQNAAGALQGSRTNSLSKTIALAPTIDTINVAGSILGAKPTSLMQRFRTIKSLFNPEVRDDLSSFIRHHEVSEMLHKPARNAATTAFMVAPKERSWFTPRQRMTAATVGLLGGAANNVMGPNFNDLLENMQPGVKDLGAESVSKALAQMMGRSSFGPARAHHANPGVILDELRSVRMMSPEVQRIQSAMRAFGGELGRGVDSSNMVVPSPKTKGYRDLVSKLQGAADAPYAAVDNTVNKWYGRGGKLVSFLEANSPKLKGIFEGIRNAKI